MDEDDDASTKRVPLKKTDGLKRVLKIYSIPRLWSLT